MTTVKEFIRDRDHILVGFDGVLCAVDHNNRVIADRLKILVSPGLPAAIVASDDPFEVLRYAATCGAATASAVERHLRMLELPTVTSVPVMPGAAAAMQRLASAGYRLTAVSSLSTDVVRSFLFLHDLGDPIRGIAARTSAATRLPPDPDLLHHAMRSLGARPEQCVMIAGTVPDIQAAAAADIPVIAYALRGHGAALIVQDMAELASAGAPEFTWKRY